MKRLCGTTCVVVFLLLIVGSTISTVVGQTVIKRVNAFEGNSITAPDELSKLGIASYDLKLSSQPAKVTFVLYDTRKSYVATVEASELIFSGNYNVSITTAGNRKDWIRIEKNKIDDISSFSLLSSTGVSYKINTKVKNTPKANAFAIDTICYELNSDIINVPLREMANRSEDQLNPLQQLEHDMFQSSKGLSLMESVLKQWDEMVWMARVENFQPMSPTCTVACFHLTLLTELYYCDGGYFNGCSCGNGGGLFMIEGCTWLIQPCYVRCAMFPAEDGPPGA